MSWRSRLADLAGQVLFRTGAYRRLLHGRAVIVVFHRVDDRYPLDPLTVSAGEFRRYCEHFARYWRVVPLGSLVGMLESGEDVSRCLVITFDDGYRDNHAVAAPILESLGLPACFFVTTGFVGSDAIPWWDSRAGITPDWMSWDEVCDLHRRGFEIGAHTVTHADLGQVEGEEAMREIVGSREALETRLGVPVTLFAYPYGRVHQISEANRTLVRQAGFQCCLSAYGGAVQPGNDPFALRRQAGDRWFRSPEHFGVEVMRA